MVLRIKSSSIQKRQLVLWFLVHKKPSNIFLDFSQFNCSVMSDSLQPHGLQHTRLPCPSPSPREGSNSCPLSQWYHPTISSSVVPFSTCPQSSPASRFFPGCWRFPSGGQSIKASARLSNEYSGLISFRIDCLRSSQESSPPPFEGISSSVLSLLNDPTLTSIHDYWKNHSFDFTDLCQQSDVSTF